MKSKKLKSAHSNSVKRNIAANFSGSIWRATMGLVFIPLYIKFMGIEAYGLIGIFATLQIVLGLLDVGLSSTLTREMARLSVLPHKEQEMRNLVRTLETLYWSIAVFVGVTVVLLSPFISQHWINEGQLSPQIIEQALLLMGFVMVFQMPIGFYTGGMMGLQKQVQYNVIDVCMSTLRGAGSVLILWLVSPTIKAFLLWQLVISLIHAVVLALFLWCNLPQGENKALFQKQLFFDNWRFATGMSGISILAVILTQLDKIILSKILSLEMFGYYMVASMVAMSLSRLFMPVFLSIYPKFTQLASANDQDGLILLYHKSCQFIAVLILPVAIFIAFFSYEVVLLWTQDPVTAEKTHQILSVMILGNAINGLMHCPHALQLAFGWTKLPVLKNLCEVIILVPLISFMAIRYGAIGAAIAWFFINLGDIIFVVPIMHRRLLRAEKWRWYLQDVCLPLVVCICVAAIGRTFVSQQMSQIVILQYLIVISVSILGVAVVATPVARLWLFDQLEKLVAFK